MLLSNMANSSLIGGKVLDRKPDRRLLVVIAAAVVAVIVLPYAARIEIPVVAAVVVGLVLIVVGFYLGSATPESLISIRTGSTLASGATWRETHRLARWLYSLQGVVVLSTALRGSLWIWVTLVGLALNVVILGLYSNWISRAERQEDRNN